MSDIETTNPDTEQDVQTWLFAVISTAGWGCGNTHEEAIANIKRFNKFHKTQTPYLLVGFTQPVKDVYGSGFGGIGFTWAGERGEAVEIPMNGWEV